MECEQGSAQRDEAVPGDAIRGDGDEAVELSSDGVKPHGQLMAYARDVARGGLLGGALCGAVDALCQRLRGVGDVLE